jgi:hypothetical protein
MIDQLIGLASSMPRIHVVGPMLNDDPPEHKPPQLDYHDVDAALRDVKLDRNLRILLAELRVGDLEDPARRFAGSHIS